MGEEVGVKEDINKVIKQKITDAKTVESARKLLLELLTEELLHVDERDAWYGWKNFYESLVKKYTSKD